jgi:phenylpropionate dioxygenase-like ring-hydroxylating dioxygenase large terminal subunit
VHGLSFGLDGARLAADRSRRLVPHVVAQAGEAIFVLAGDGQAVGPTVGLDPRLAQPLQPLGRWAISDLQADWKLVVEHWADVYLHPSGAARSFLLGDKTTIAVSESETGATWKQTLQGDASCWAAAKYVQLAATRPGEGAPMIIERRILWPSIMIEFRPDGITLRQVLPRGPGRSTLRVRRYAIAPATRERRVLNYLAFRLERVWAAEDLAILESTQAGVAQLAEQVDQAGETLTASFWAWLRAACPSDYND